MLRNISTSSSRTCHIRHGFLFPTCKIQTDQSQRHNWSTCNNDTETPHNFYSSSPNNIPSPRPPPNELAAPFRPAPQPTTFRQPSMAHAQAHHPSDPHTDRVITSTASDVRVERRREEEPRPMLSSGRVEEYRGGCLKLEKLRHARVYDAERRKIYCESAILATYQQTVLDILDGLDAAKRTRLMKALSDNAEKTRQVEELRYGICKDEIPGTWQRRHEMSLRGRNHEREEELLEDKPKRRKEPRRNVRVSVELDEAQVMLDLAEMRGDKRPREEQPERKSKKRK